LKLVSGEEKDKGIIAEGIPLLANLRGRSYRRPNFLGLTGRHEKKEREKDFWTRGAYYKVPFWDFGGFASLILKEG